MLRLLWWLLLLQLLLLLLLLLLLWWLRLLRSTLFHIRRGRGSSRFGAVVVSSTVFVLIRLIPQLFHGGHHGLEPVEAINVEPQLWVTMAQRSRALWHQKSRRVENT